MKKFKNRLVCFSILLGGFLLASEPGTTVLTTKGASVFSGQNVISRKLILKGETLRYTFNPAVTMSKSCITGHTKTTESRIQRLLHWDCRIKWRLNRNMNIILSYN